MITEKELSLVLDPPSHMTTDGDHILHQKVFFAFRHFGIPVVKCFDTPTLDIWNYEMESDQRFGILVFHISEILCRRVSMLQVAIPEMELSSASSSLSHDH